MYSRHIYEKHVLPIPRAYIGSWIAHIEIQVIRFTSIYVPPYACISPIYVALIYIYISMIHHLLDSRLLCGIAFFPEGDLDL